MIEYIKGDLLDAPDGSIIVHGCNCQGVMGSGVALAIKNKWPFMYDIYKEHERDWGLWVGEISYGRAGNVIIVNGYTQDQYGRDKKIRYVNYEGVANVFENIKRTFLSVENPNIKNVAFPKIGAGLANGDWDIISTIIDKTLPDTIAKTCYVL